MNEMKVSKCHDAILKVFQEHGLTVSELVLVFGNLGYSLGASIEGFKEVGPSQEEAIKRYYTNPDSIGNAMMAQGILMTSWYDKLVEQQKQTKEEK